MKLKEGRWEGSIEGCITLVGNVPWEWDFTNWLVRRGWYPENTEYEYNAHPIHPLTYVRPDGTRKRPNKKFRFDGATIYPIFRPFVGIWDFICAAIGHDSDYEFKGAWFWHEWSKEWVYEEMTREQADRDLGEGALAEGVPRAKAIFIWSVVSRFGGFVWNSREKDSPDKRRKMCEHIRAKLTAEGVV